MPLSQCGSSPAIDRGGRGICLACSGGGLRRWWKAEEEGGESLSGEGRNLKAGRKGDRYRPCLVPFTCKRKKKFEGILPI